MIDGWPLPSQKHKNQHRGAHLGSSTEFLLRKHMANDDIEMLLGPKPGLKKYW